MNAWLRLGGLFTLGVSLVGCSGGWGWNREPAGPQIGSSIEPSPTWKWAEKFSGKPANGYAFSDPSVQQANWFTDLPVVKSITLAVKGDDTTAQNSPPDATSLANRAKPSAELYLATGRLSEQAGNLDEAEQQYQHALRLSPKQTDALVAYAHLKERQGNLDEATRLLHQAADGSPDDPAIYNALGLCYAKRTMYREASVALDRAIQLDPPNPLYRNNIATVLVDMGDIDGAYLHLAAVHGEAAACYNLGYLLNVKGRPDTAARLFAKALEKNPNLVEARAWLDRLQVQTPRPFGQSPQNGPPPSSLSSPEYYGIPAADGASRTAARPSASYPSLPRAYY